VQDMLYRMALSPVTLTSNYPKPLHLLHFCIATASHIFITDGDIDFKFGR